LFLVQHVYVVVIIWLFNNQNGHLCETNSWVTINAISKFGITKGCFDYNFKKKHIPYHLKTLHVYLGQQNDLDGYPHIYTLLPTCND
jgi:hypothetical protein